MRTKTLLIAAAALVAGVISSEAQTVYSVNVVGYATVVYPGNGQFTLLANPFDNGNGNQLTNVVDPSNTLPKQSQVLIWDPVLGYTTITKVGTPPAWPTSVSLPPGTGFFVRNGNVGSGAIAITNTFVGNVIVPSGGSVTNAEPPGFTLQGATIPYAGNIANAGQAGGDTNLDYGSALGKQSQLLTWDPVLGFTTVTKVGSTPTWPSTVTVGVAQGFFVNSKNAPSTNMVQNATY